MQDGVAGWMAELRLVHGERLSLCKLLPGGEAEGLQRQVAQQLGSAAMPGPEEVKRKAATETRGGLLRGAAAGFMVGVEVPRPGGEQVVLGSQVRQKLLDEGLFMISDPAVGKMQTEDVPRVDSQASRSLGLLGRAAFRQAGVLCVGVFTVGHGDELDGVPLLGLSGEEAAGCKGLVIRVRGEDDQGSGAWLGRAADRRAKAPSPAGFEGEQPWR